LQGNEDILIVRVSLVQLRRRGGEGRGGEGFIMLTKLASFFY
jgi:hypothetical protein